MISIKNLTVGFNLGTPSSKIVLNKFNLEVNNQDFVVLLGSNGAGKSTLFNSILGTVSYDGEISIDGKSLNGIPQHKRSKRIGVVFQDPLRGTAPNLKVIDNILLSTKKRFLLSSKKKFKEEAIEELKTYGLGLEEHLDSQAKTLSGGQRQALTLYMATNSNPEILLLDEHTAALDPNTQQIVMDITDKVVKEKKITTLMITHNLKSAIKYGNRLIVLNNGHVALDISGEEKQNLTEDKLLSLYKDHLSDRTVFSIVEE